MSEFEADVLFELAHNVQAWRVLQDPRSSGEMDAEGILHQCRKAGYSEKVAQEAARQRADQRLDAGVPAVSSVYVHQ